MNFEMTPAELTTQREAVGAEGRELAELAGITPAYLSMLEHGKRRISEKLEERLQAALEEARAVQAERRRQMREAMERAWGRRKLRAWRVEKGFTE